VHALDVVQGGDAGAGGDQRAGTDLADAEHAGKRCTHAAVADVGLHFAHAGFGGIADGALGVEGGTGDELLGRQFTLALVQLVGFGKGGLGLQQGGFLGLAAQGHQGGAGGDLLAAVEVHGVDDFADFGGDGHRLAGLGGAECLQGVAPGGGLHDLGGHRHDFGLPAGGLVLAATPGQDGQAEAGNDACGDASRHEVQPLMFHDRQV